MTAAPRANVRRISPSSMQSAKAQATKVTITLELAGELREFEITPSKLPLIFVEALEDMKQDGSWRNMRLGIQKLLKLTDEESMELETDHIVQIAAAIGEATDIPNGGN